MDANLLEIFQTILHLLDHFAALETEAACGRGRRREEEEYISVSSANKTIWNLAHGRNVSLSG